MDLGDRRFAQNRDSYLRGGTTSPKPGDSHPLLTWLPHCRRKLFFEWQDVQKAEQLVPFLFLPKYLRLLTGDTMLLDRSRRELVLGLNRAFSKLYLTGSESLYITSQYARAVEQPVPLVKVEIPLACIQLKSQPVSAEAFDCDRQQLVLEILPPPRVSSEQPINWNVDLLRFEYLMRLAQGGTYNVLNTECELAIRQLKNQLLSRFVQSNEGAGRLGFFAVEQYHYQLKELQVDQGGKVRM